MNWFWRPIHKTIFPNTCCVKFHWFYDGIAFQSTPVSLHAKMTNIFWHKVAARCSSLPLWRVRCKIKQWTSLTVLLKPFFCFDFFTAALGWVAERSEAAVRSITLTENLGSNPLFQRTQLKKRKETVKGHNNWTKLMLSLFFIFSVFSITFTYPQVFGCAP